MIGSGMSILCFIALRMITQENSVENAIQRGQQIIGELCGHSSQRPATDYLQVNITLMIFALPEKNSFQNQQKYYLISEISDGSLFVENFTMRQLFRSSHITIR